MKRDGLGSFFGSVEGAYWAAFAAVDARVLDQWWASFWPRTSAVSVGTTRKE
jgi:hypothetical protein